LDDPDLTATRLAEVGHGGQLGIDGPPAEPTVVQVVDGLLGVLLLLELDVDVAHEVVAQVVAHVHLLHLAVLVLAINEDILKEVVIMLLQEIHLELNKKFNVICTNTGYRIQIQNIEYKYNQSTRRPAFPRR
jgi:hypothetical protein